MLNIPIIEVSNLQKNYKSTAVIDDVSFQVNDGEIFGLLVLTAPVKLPR